MHLLKVKATCMILDASAGRACIYNYVRRKKKDNNEDQKTREPLVVSPESHTAQNTQGCEGRPSNPDGSVYLVILPTKCFKIDFCCSHTARLGRWRRSRPKGNL